jgi:primosomal protein N' (replication factor Y)
VPRERAFQEAAAKDKRAPKQALLLRTLAAQEPPALDVAELAQDGIPATAVKPLEKNGLVRVQQRREERDPLAGRRFPLQAPLTLTTAQQAAWREIEKALVGKPPAGRAFLLRGVTGSGKTELYLRALERVVAEGGRGIVLVPEISLTAQTIERFSGRFPGRVAVLHSRLTPGQQFDEWWRIRGGAFDVVIGSRSAVFAPQPNLRLIVVDEEHEWTYKQQEPAPRYHAREVALRLADLTGAVVIMGSATPAVESYYRARSGGYRLLELPERIATGGDAAPLPDVRLVDMRSELRSGNRTVFSRALRAGIVQALKRKQQVMLFLNRRGAATFVQCRDCGHVLTCRRCAATLVYHAGDGEVRCHHCNFSMLPPAHCSQCLGPNVRYVGLGTERLEVETLKAFPDAVTLRWDSDVAVTGEEHERIMRQFLDREADILIGTQMIAKGLHLPGVTLVGVVNADIGLHTPDFRAGERVFQVLCQVAGRAGRGEERGSVVIQTYSPEHYAIQAASRQDFVEFYEQELANRLEARQPPFNRLARLVYSHANAGKAQAEAERVGTLLKARLAEWAYPGAKIIGPAPATLERLRGRYRWHVIIQAPDPLLVLDNMPLPEAWVVDVDPVSLV